jgi:UDP-N-acetyl-D-glucosamine dehydrogenase
MRESPSWKLIELLAERRANVEYHDPFIAAIPRTRKRMALEGRRSLPLDAHPAASLAAVMIATDHDCVDYPVLARRAKRVVEASGMCAAAGLSGAHIAKA